MLFRWLRRRRRRQQLSVPFPSDWHHILDQNLWYYSVLDNAERSKLRDDLRVFIAEKNWEGCGGLVLRDEIQVTIAGQMAILVLGFPEQYFPKMKSILVYPDAYVAPDTTTTEAGVVVEGKSAREGEAWYRGPVILSWSDALAGGRGTNRGNNLVFHELAHQFDMQNGRHVDGTPPLESAHLYQRWAVVMARHYQQLVDDCQNGRHPLFDCYGATNIGEFFAVATEVFFQRSRVLRDQHPELYSILRQFYRQDPAARKERPRS